MRKTITMYSKSFHWIAAVVIALTLAGCGNTDPIPSGSTSFPAPPPADPAEGLVQSDDESVAAELIATPAVISPDERTQVRVLNRGSEPLGFGRPFTIEKWDGEAWVETEDSLNSMWTMDMLYVEPGAAGVEQAWPFLPDHRPEAGWYRFTKHVSAEPSTPGQNPVSLTLRSRVEVRK
jgi:hypothetical protein